MSAKAVFTGDKEMRELLERGAREFPIVVRRAAKEYAQESLLPPAVANAPEKTGKLKRSARVKVSIRKKAGKENVAATVVFGGGPEKVRYAIPVHEKHPTHAKFLERVIQGAVNTAGPAIAEKVALKREQTWLAGLKKAERAKR